MMLPPPFRYLLTGGLALICCSCTSPEERAQRAFTELCSVVAQIQAELAAVTDAETAEAAVPALEQQAEALREVLERLDALADDPDLPQDARRRVGEAYHKPLRAVVDAALAEGLRLARHALWQSRGLERLYRRELVQSSTRKGAHPWPRAVLAGREYVPKPQSRKNAE